MNTFLVVGRLVLSPSALFRFLFAAVYGHYFLRCESWGLVFILCLTGKISLSSHLPVDTVATVACL